MVSSRILHASVAHERRTPILYRFQYRLYYYAFDLDELHALSKRHWWFGYNKRRPVSIFDTDYLASHRDGVGRELPDEGSSIRQRVEFFLSARGVGRPERVILLTGARYFGYIFNPASFFFCYDGQGRLTAFITEINNTFDERHIYLFAADEGIVGQTADAGMWNFSHRKEFHVSPFHDMGGAYQFRVRDIEKDLDIEIDIVKDGKAVFRSRLRGESKALTGKSLAGTLLTYPLSAVLNLPRIFWQAAKLYYFHQLPVYTKPRPSSADTIKVARPRMWERVACKAICRVLSHAKRGRLILTLPRGEQLIFGGSSEGVRACIEVHRYKFFSRILVSGGIGLGESYQHGEWSSPDLTAVFQFLLDNRSEVGEQRFSFTWLGRWRNRREHRRRSNNPQRSRSNVSAHYDYGNKFFAEFLDPSLSYSCAIFEGVQDSLERAQTRKIDLMLKKARLHSASHVLEIGSGWGALALRIASEYECKVTSLTLSQQQLELANQRIDAAGFSDQAQVILKDYREISGSYDSIVSVEMLEAVGHEHLGAFFEQCEKVLKPDGIVVLQVITMPESRYEHYRRGCDWIQKYIFPGACVPSLTAIVNAASARSNLVVEQVENFGPHYSQTLKEWRERYDRAVCEGRITPKSEHERRTWEYYFAYCEAGFERRALNLLQLTFSRPQNKRLNDLEFRSVSLSESSVRLRSV